MTTKDINDLWLQYKNIDISIEDKQKLENQLVLHYYTLVQRIAKTVAAKIDYKRIPEELISYGVEGLYTSIRRFDLSRHTKFEGYARIRVRGAIIDGLRQEDIVPRSVRINHNCYERTKAQLESIKLEKVLDDEIFEKMEIKDFVKYHNKYKPSNYSSLNGLDAFAEKNDCRTDFNENLIDDTHSKPDSILMRKEFLNKLIGTNFSKLEQKILYYYYWENLSLGVISKLEHMSESRISQIHKILLKRLKDKIERNPNYFDKEIIPFINNLKNKDSIF